MKRTVAALLVVVLFLPLLTVTTGCDDASMKAFRQTASSGIATGLKSILSAIVDGIDAAANPKDGTGTTTTTKP
jgi:hypothetical protein